MGKFKEDMLVRGAKAEKERQKEQARLKDKHRIADPDIIVVEKTNLLKFLIRCLALVIWIAATIFVVLLASIGVIALVYPEIREVLLQVLNGILIDVRQMLL